VENQVVPDRKRLYRAIVLDPSNRPNEQALEHNLDVLRRTGLTVDYLPCNVNVGELLGREGTSERGSILSQALHEDCDYIIPSIGGYGASDLIRVLNWDLLESQNPKIVVGFSDISALQVALYTRLGWPALHGPVPGSRVWEEAPDIDLLLSMLSRGRPWINEIKLDSSIQADLVSGTLLGGCFSVLTNLIGTPYLPASLSGYILFFEDKNENAGRILRFWNQWLDSGLLNGVSAVVLGRFNNLHAGRDEVWLHERLLERTECPVFVSEDFGHDGPNIPIAIGAYAEISSNLLRWILD